MAGNGFEISFYNDETGQWEVTPAPSAKPLAVRKKKAAQAKEPSAGDYLNTLGDVFFVNPRNSAAATLGGAAYDYAVKSTPRSVVRDITESAEDAGDWLRKEGKLIRAAPITESLRLLKAGFIDPLADPYRVFKQAATERARGNTTGGKKLAAMVPLAVAGVLPQARGAGKLAVREGVEAATKKATKKVAKAEPKPRKEKYQPVEPVENPHPELANVEFPEGSGRGGAFAVANQVPIVGRKPFIAQSKKGYSGLSGGLPANKVVANVKPFVEMAPRQFITPEDLAKDFNSIIPFIGDKLRGGTEILDIAGRPQEGGVRAYAGPDFARQQLGVGGREVWASGPSVISGLENAAKEAQDRFGGRVAGVYTTMGPEAADQSTAMIDLIGRQIAAGDINPKDLAVFDDMVRNTTRKDDEAVRDFIGFGTNPLAAIDQLNDIGRTTMGQRRTVTQLMNSAPFLNAGFPDIGANRAGISTPELLYAPEGTSGFSISALEPGKGPLAPEDVSMRHPNYSHKLGGTYLGGFEVGVPRELVWSQLYNRPEMKQYEPFRQLSYLFGRAPKAIRQDLGYNPLIQPLDQEWVDSVSEYINAVKKFGPDGFAEGGLAVRPEQVSSSGFAVRR
jgi:hypothetical protein